MQAEFDRPEVQELIENTRQLTVLAYEYPVATAEHYSKAGEDLKLIKGTRARLEELRKSFTAPLDLAKKNIMDFFRRPAAQLDEAESRIKRSMISFSDEQDRIRREEQRRADEAARREQEKLNERARKAAEAGRPEKAAALEQRAETIVAPVIHREPPKVAGVSTREVPKFEIVDEKAIPREYLIPDVSKIRGVVNSLKMDANIPGVRVWMEKQLAAGAA